MRPFNIFLLQLFLFSISIPPLHAEKIVLFYIGSAPPGTAIKNGHVAACEAVRDQILLSSGEGEEKAEIILKNINDFRISAPDDILMEERRYIDLIKNRPEEYTQQYKITKKSLNAIDPLLLDTDINLTALRDFLLHERINTAIGAHWLVPTALSQIKAGGELSKLKTGWIYTDYYDNPLFPKIAQNIDMTFVGSSTLRDKFIARGVPAELIHASGIPINPYASQSIDVGAFKKRKGLSVDDDYITITLAGGGEGLGDFLTIVKSIIEKYKGQGKKIQLIAITAKNAKHKSDLEELQRILDARTEKDPLIYLKIEGTVKNEDMLDYVKASDLYIVKSGGLSPTEGAVIGKPMVLLDVLGGHEHDNANFYEEIGIGIINHNPRDIGAQIFDLLSDPIKLAQMQRAQATFRQERDFALAGSVPLHRLSPLVNPRQMAREAQINLFLDQLKLAPRGEIIFIDKGRELLDSGNIEGAKLKMEEALLANPSSVGAHFLLAHIYHLLQNDEKAIYHLDRSIELDSDSGGGSDGQYYHRALIELQRGEDAKGREDLLKQLNSFTSGPYIFSQTQRLLLKNAHLLPSPLSLTQEVLAPLLTSSSTDPAVPASKRGLYVENIKKILKDSISINTFIATIRDKKISTINLYELHTVLNEEGNWSKVQYLLEMCDRTGIKVNAAGSSREQFDQIAHFNKLSSHKFSGLILEREFWNKDGGTLEETFDLLRYVRELKLTDHKDVPLQIAAYISPAISDEKTIEKLASLCDRILPACYAENPFFAFHLCKPIFRKLLKYNVEISPILSAEPHFMQAYLKNPSAMEELEHIFSALLRKFFKEQDLQQFIGPTFFTNKFLFPEEEEKSCLQLPEEGTLWQQIFAIIKAMREE